MRKYFILPLVACIMAMMWGCSNEQVMGGDLVPPSDKSVVRVIDTITINAYTELEDSVSVKYSEFLMAGELDDPIFGKSSSSFATKFSNTSYAQFKFGSICDSVILTLGLDTSSQRFYGDALSEVTMKVYKLSDSISETKSYSQYFDIMSLVDPEPLATSTFIPSKADTMVSFHLPVEYGEMVMRSVADTTFDDNCFGFYFALEADNCMMMFSRSSKYTEYTIYHKMMGDTVSKASTFSIRQADPRISSFAHDYSSTKFNSQLQNPAKYQDTAIYMQAMAGTKMRLEFPHLAKLNDLESGYVAITNATLLMPLADSLGVGEDKYPAIENLVCSGKYDSGLQFYPEDFLSYQTGYSPWRTAYAKDAKNHRYSINMTSAIVKMMKIYKEGGKPNYAIYVSPNGTITDFSRSVINSPTHPDNPMKLVVEYLVFEK